QEIDMDATLEAWQAIDDEITALFVRGQRDGEFRPELTAAWLTAMFYSLVGGTAWSIRAGRAAARDFDRLIIDLLLHGVTS
ncbi:TetR family transcriptional regulator, partial [Mycolicibacterium austroafricanum]